MRLHEQVSDERVQGIVIPGQRSVAGRAPSLGAVALPQQRVPQRAPRPVEVAQPAPAPVAAPAAAPLVPALDRAPTWRRRIARRLWVSDALVVTVVTFAVQLVWLGPGLGRPVSGGSAHDLPGPTYTVLSAVIAAVWMAALTLVGARSHRVLGRGSEEYRRIFSASVGVFGVLAVVAFSLQYEVARGYVGIVFPAGVVALVAERWVWRRWLNARRGAGAMVTRVLVVGTEISANALAGHIGRISGTGLQVCGVLPVAGSGPTVDVARVLREAESLGVDAVAVTTSARLEPTRLRDLRWALEDRGAELIIAPALTGLSGRRVHTRPVDGLSLLHVDGAEYDGTMRVAKGVADRLLAAGGLLALSPLLLVTGLLVRLTSPGPAFYRQERVGRDGHTFHIWKFRSMRLDADAQLQALMREQGAGAQPLFKLARDPRVTPVGAVLRKWSIDELPQLLNVVRGDMSLVGPRPQRPAEVALYDDAAERRLKVKPGLTGLWQVSGRSDLPWPEAVELDLYYVENWSIVFDLQLLWRTVSAVLRGRGAY